MNSRSSPLLLLAVIYLGFVSLGLPDGTLGVAWPAMAEGLGLAIGLAGVVTLVVTTLSAVSGFSSDRIVARHGTGRVVLVSCLLTATALLGISQARSFSWLLLAAIPLGLGAGAVDAGLNGYVARHYSGRHMNWLHACWGLGATAGPIVMGQALGSDFGWRGGYVAIGGIQLTLAVGFLATLRLWAVVPERATASEDAAPVRARPTLGADSFPGWLSPALFVLYVGIETAAGLWAVSILMFARQMPAQEAALAAAGYYAAIMIGRVLVGFIVERAGNRRIIGLGLGLAFLGALGFALGGARIAPAGLVLLGLGFAPFYPGLMHEVPRRFAPDAAQTVIGRQTGAAYIGMATLPAVLGTAAAYSLAIIPGVIAVGVVVLALGVRQLNRMT